MKYTFINRLLAILLFAGLSAVFCSAETLQFIYVSDTHYGVYRTFRQRESTASVQVNRAMIEEMNRIHELNFPADGGVKAGQPVGAMDAVINTGDIANRAEQGIQSATISWRQFAKDWLGGRLRVKNGEGELAPLFLSLGNHEVSNAIGHYKVLHTDNTPCVEIYNRMMHPAVPLTRSTYDYSRHKVHYSLTLKGVHLAFVNMWLDRGERAWLATDLQQAGNLPTLLFVHDQPEAVTRHFTNPNGRHDINANDRFENLLTDTCSVPTVKERPLKEYRELATFLHAHPTIKVWFHGHENYTEFYRWRGPDATLSLPTIRVDSSMKGEVSGSDDRKLSFLVVTIDTDSLRMTVREYLWNAGGKPHSGQWGASRSFRLE